MNYYLSKSVYRVYLKLLPAPLIAFLMVVIFYFVSTNAASEKAYWEKVHRHQHEMMHRLEDLELMIASQFETVGTQQTEATLRDAYKKIGFQLKHIEKYAIVPPIDALRSVWTHTWEGSDRVALSLFVFNGSQYVGRCHVSVPAHMITHGIEGLFPLRTDLESAAPSTRGEFRFKVKELPFWAEKPASLGFLEYLRNEWTYLFFLVCYTFLISTVTLFYFIFGPEKVMKMESYSLKSSRAKIKALESELEVMKEAHATQENLRCAAETSTNARWILLKEVLVVERLHKAVYEELLCLMEQAMTSTSSAHERLHNIKELIMTGRKTTHDGQGDLEEKLTSFVNILNFAMDVHAVDIHAKELQVMTELQEPFCIPHAKGVLLVVSYLIGKRIQALPKRGKLWVTSYFEGNDQFIIKLTDNGYALSSCGKGMDLKHGCKFYNILEEVSRDYLGEEIELKECCEQVDGITTSIIQLSAERSNLLQFA